MRGWLQLEYISLQEMLKDEKMTPSIKKEIDEAHWWASSIEMIFNETS